MVSFFSFSKRVVVSFSRCYHDQFFQPFQKGLLRCCSGQFFELFEKRCSMSQPFCQFFQVCCSFQLTYFSKLSKGVVAVAHSSLFKRLRHCHGQFFQLFEKSCSQFFQTHCSFQLAHSFQPFQKGLLRCCYGQFFQLFKKSCGQFFQVLPWSVFLAFSKEIVEV